MYDKIFEIRVMYRS